MSDTTRRAVLAGAAGITAVTVLAACGDDSDDSGSTGDSSTGGAAAGVLATKADIPVGGGKIFKDGGGVVVTQPEVGKFKAFSSICTSRASSPTSPPARSTASATAARSLRRTAR